MANPETQSPDQVVSSNLVRARELRGWTQREAAERISRHHGKTWTIAMLAAAERSHRTPRVKEFSASEITAFCRAFELPLAWFFLPRDPWTRVLPRGADEAVAISGDDLLSLIFPRLDDPMTAELEEAAKAIFNTFAAQGPARDNLPTYLGWVQRQNAALRAMVLSEFKAHDLEKLPAELEDAAARMRQALGLVVNDLRHDGIPAADE